MADKKDFRDIDGVEKYVESTVGAPPRLSNPEYAFRPFKCCDTDQILAFSATSSIRMISTWCSVVSSSDMFRCQPNLLSHSSLTKLAYVVRIAVSIQPNYNVSSPYIFLVDCWHHRNGVVSRLWACPPGSWSLGCLTGILAGRDCSLCVGASYPTSHMHLIVHPQGLCVLLGK